MQNQLHCLLKLQASSKGTIKQTARTALYRVNGPGIDKTIINNAASATPILKTEYLVAIGERQMTSGIPILFKSLEDKDSKVRMASLRSLRAVATPAYMNEALENLAKPKSEQERKELERVVTAIALKVPEGESKAALINEKYKATKDAKTKVSLLEVLGKIGDPASLPIIRTSLNDKNPEIKTAAIRSLSNWPDSKPLNDLLGAAKTSSDEKSKILALRGYVRLISFEKDKSSKEILAMYQVAMELATNTDEKRAVLSGLSTIISIDAFEFVEAYIDDKTLQQEAAASLTKIAGGLIKDGKNIQSKKDIMYKSLSIINSEELKKNCRNILNELEKFEDFITTWEVAGPYQNQESDIFAFVFPPESGKAVEWKKVTENSDKKNYWNIDLGVVLGSFGPVAYLRNVVISDKNQDVQMQVGSNDGVKVWLNGELVHANNAARGITPGEDKINVRLKKGNNTVLIKITNAGGAWGGCARFRTVEGGKLEGLKVELGK